MRHLRNFGCAAYAHVAKDERQKLDTKSRKCVLLGYGTERKGYRLYDPSRERVYYSRDVVFDESSRGIEREQSVPERSSERCVELDFHDGENKQNQWCEDQTRRRKHLITMETGQVSLMLS